MNDPNWPCKKGGLSRILGTKAALVSAIMISILNLLGGQSFAHEPIVLSRPVLVLDSAVADHDRIGSALSPDMDILQLDPAQDGLAQIANYLTARHDVPSVHILSHGRPGEIMLSGRAINTSAVLDHMADMTNIRKALAANADIFLYGCQTAKDAAGLTFITELANLTGAHVAASTHPVGAISLGGDWTLDRASAPTTSVPIALSDTLFPNLLPSASIVFVQADFNGAGQSAASTYTISKTVTYNASNYTFVASTLTPPGPSGQTNPFIDWQTSQGYSAAYFLDYSVGPGYGGTDFILTAPSGYVFDLTSFDYNFDSTSSTYVKIQYTYGNGSTSTTDTYTTGSSPAINIGAGVQTLSSFMTAPTGIKSITISTDNFFVLNNLVVTNIQSTGPTATQSISSKALTQNFAATSFTPVTGSGGTAPLAYSISPALPTGLSINSSTGAITGTPTVTQSATTYTVTVTDNAAATATNTFSLTVNSAVAAAQSVASKSLTQNFAATSFTPVTGSGGTGTLAYSISPALPTGLSISSSTGAITGTPTATQSATTHTVTVTDSNGATGTNTFSLTVNTAVTATQSVASKSLTQNIAAVSFTPVTGAGGTGTLTYSISPSLPANLSLNSSTGAITGTSTVTQTATTHTVTVTDTNGATATNTFSLTVNSAVGAAQAVANKSVTQNTAITSFTPVTGSGGTGALTYTISPTLPNGLSIASGSGAITGTSTVTLSATTFTVTVTDTLGSTNTNTFSLTVNTTVTATQAIASQSAVQNTAVTSFTPVTGAGGTGALTYTISPTLPNGLSIASGTGAITGTPTVTLSATTFTVTVTDTVGATANNTFSLTVNPAVVATQSVATNSLSQGVAATSFTPVTGSGGTGALTYTISPTLPNGLSIASATGAITGTPTVSLSATTFTVTVTDTLSVSATNTFSLTVNGPLTATQAIASKGVTQNTAVTSFTPVTGAGGTAPLTYSISPALPNNLTLNTNTGAITGTATATQASTTYTVTVADNAAATATQTFALTVNSAIVATQAVASNSLTQFVAATSFTPVTATGGTGALTYTISPTLPAGLSIASGSGAITGTPSATLSATMFTITATDTVGATATNAFSLTVTAPTISIAATSLNATVYNTAFSQTLTASGGTSPYSFTISAGSLPAGLSLTGGNGTTTKAISGTPTAAGAYSFTVRATDTNSVSGTQAYSGTVATASQTITFSNPGTVLINASPSLTATGGGSGNAVTFTSATTGVCTITTGGALTPVAVGTCTISANQSGNANYAAASQVQQSFSITLVPQTITLTAPSTLVAGNSASVIASSTSNLAVTVSSTTANICTYSAGSVTAVSAGTCSLSANQAGNTTYASASTSANFTVTAGKSTPPPDDTGPQPVKATITVTVQPPAAGTPGSGAAGTGVATATIPAAAFPSNPTGTLTYTLAADTTPQTSSGSTGTLSINVPASNPSAPLGSVVKVSFDTTSHVFTLVSPVITRPGARSNQTLKPTSGTGSVIANDGAGAVAAPVLSPYQVTAPKVLALKTNASLAVADGSGSITTIQIPVTIYAPGEVADLVAVSIDPNGNFGTNSSTAPVLSRDGQVMSFLSSDQNFGILGGSGLTQVMRYAVQIQTLDLISQGTLIGLTNGIAAIGGHSFSPAVSADGSTLGFASDATNIYPIYPVPNTRQVYLAGGNTVLNAGLTPSPIPLALNGLAAIGQMDNPALNADGTIIAFESSYAWVPGAPAGIKQIYLKNMATGTYSLVSKDLLGNPGNANSSNPSVSDDGRFVLFESDATNLVGSQVAPNVRQIYFKDTQTGTVTLISSGLDGAPGNAISSNPKLSGVVPFNAQGLSAVFESDATNLVKTSVTGRQVYRRDITGRFTTLVSANSTGAVGGSNPSISGDGRFVVYKSSGAVTTPSAPAGAQIYAFDAYANKTALVTLDVNGLPANAGSDTPTISADGRTIGFVSLANNLDGTGTNNVGQSYIAANKLVSPLANGFWTNANLPGVYYAIEQSGDRLWFAALGYNGDYTPNWTFSAESALGPTSFTGSLYQTAGGQTLTGSYMSAVYGANFGPTNLLLGSPTSASLAWSQYNLAIQRYEFVTGGASAGQVAGYPETGWWYNPVEPDRALFMEVQGASLFATFLAYNTNGRAIWYQTTGAMSSANAYAGNLYVCTGPAIPTCTTNAGAINLAFSSTLAAIMTLPNGNKIPLQRWRF